MIKLIDRIIKSFFQTIVEIIEDKPNFTIPLPLYVILILTFFLQQNGYLFNTKTDKTIRSEQFFVIARLSEMSTGTYLFCMKGNDTLTYIGYIFIQLSIYFYYIYVILLTYLRSYMKEWLRGNKIIFKHINQILNIFFTFYYWIFQIPILEMNFQMLTCNDNSYLVEYQTEENCHQKPFYLTVFSIIGITLAMITGLVVLYFYRNYQFNESNLLKRVFSYYQVFQLISFFIFIGIYFLTDSEDLPLIIIQIIAITHILDIIIHNPYNSLIINIIYTYSCCFFFMSMAVIAIWTKFNIIKSEELLFSILILSSLLFFLLRTIQIRKENNISILEFQKQNNQNGMVQLVEYLETIYRLSLQQNKDEKSKFQIFEILNIHIDSCQVVECVCKITNFKDKKDNLNSEDVFILIEQLFQRNLKIESKHINEQKSEFQYLKYITYLARVRNRPTKAYYELKLYTSKKKSFSIYFDLILNVLSENIEKMMTVSQKIYQKTKQENTSQSEQINEDLDQFKIVLTDEIKSNFLPLLSVFLQKKAAFWRKLLNGNYKLTNFKILATNLSKNSKEVQKFYHKYLSQTTNKLNLSSNIILSKLVEIYKCTVTSDYMSAYKFSALFQLLVNRDISKPYFILNSYNILKGDVQFIRTSLAKNQGLILNEKSEKLANFFGYTQKEFHSITHINQLMPNFISSIHDRLISNMIQRGFSPMIQNKIISFIQNKQGYLEPINIYLHNYQGNVSDYYLQAILLKLVSPKEYVVFDDKGFIQGITPKLFHMMFQKREKYRGRVKQMFHTEGPHPILVSQYPYLILIFSNTQNLVLQYQKQFKKLC